MNLQSTMSARLVYENGTALVLEAKLDPNVVKLTQSDLILEQQLVVNSNNYTFPVLNNQQGTTGGQIFPTEVRLNQQDSFIVSSLGFFLLNPSSAVDATFVAQSYPNPQVFTTSGASAAAETMYNSYMTMVVNKDVILPVWHLSRHRMVPQTQQEPLITGVENSIPYSQIDLSSDGFYPVEPNLIIIGSKGTVITITMPASMAAVTPFMRARLHFRGLLAQNSTIIT
jgi:hypothetical protein